jgi:ADP-dependent NAD(P)H-hydrate dehydratase / NAD(P)H-hydrate epimerase
MVGDAVSPCLKCETGILASALGLRRDGAPIRYKAWVCSNPECGFNIRIDNGEITLRPHDRPELQVGTGAEAAAWDHRAIDRVGVPERVLMENAGRAAALVLQRLHPDGRVVGVVGAGNNGGDALVTLRTLAAWGRDVHAVLVADRELPDPLAHDWAVPTTTDGELDRPGWDRALEGAAVVVDGILGTGVRGAPRERQAAAIRAVNRSTPTVLAMDVPSGIDPETGGVPGEAVRADVTIAFGAPKLGSLLHPARALVGRLVAVEIGFPPLQEGEAAAFVATPGWALARLPRRATDTHKNQVGRLLVVGGGMGMAGAAVLAARGALRAGIGIARVATVPGNREIVQSALPEALWVDATDGPAVRAATEESDAVVIGPGLGQDEAARRVLAWVLDATDVAAPPVLLDADALNLAAAGAVALEAVGAGRPVLLTPHPGEMSRLLDDGPGGPAERARAAADRFHAAVVLKGAPSLVAVPDGPLRVDTQGSSDLAAAGMGDTLSGVCGALLAQGLAPGDAGSVGLYLSGRAARLAGKGVSLTPSDIAERLPDALRESADGDSPPLDLPFVIFDAPAAD